MDKDPFNLVVCGVGGQGNVLASRLIGGILVEQGYKVTIGETYGASQRGGSVMSHVRVSKAQQYGPLMPPRSADLVVALEGQTLSLEMTFWGRTVEGTNIWGTTRSELYVETCN